MYRAFCSTAGSNVSYSLIKESHSCHVLDRCSSFMGALSSVWNASRTWRKFLPFFDFCGKECREKQWSHMLGITQDTYPTARAVCNAPDLSSYLTF